VTPETRYAKSGDVNIAYQVTGREGVDLVFVPGWVSHIEYAWEEPSFAPFLQRLASFSRLILLDRRGTGLSDPVDHLPTLEERMDDLRAVMDAAGSQRAFLFGISESGPMSVLFAATYPERTRGLVLCNTFARNLLSSDRSGALTVEMVNQLLDLIEGEWGTGLTARLFAPSRANDEAFVQSWARFERRAVSKGAMRKIVAMAADTDVRNVLPSIRVPTLVVHRVGDAAVTINAGRYLAENIPGAKLVELSGDDHFPWVGDTASILDEVERFVTGARPTTAPDRILATVLFVDIVDSTRHLTQRGDREWRELLERFYAILRREIERARGREVDTTGDGIFATFDGPARAIRSAGSIRDAVNPLGIEIRAGLHTGECEVAGNKVSGIAVHIGARVCGLARASEVLVSGTVKDLVAGSGLRFTDRGEHELKGVPDRWRLFSVEAQGA
jgi:pimeloyl-ACP methyl ester carboxylesterase/class 3 adenylate cyclase